MASPRSVRLSDDVLRRLSDLATRTGSSVSSTMERLLDEALRREAHPGITFRDGPSGRRAGLVAGPDVDEAGDPGRPPPVKLLLDEMYPRRLAEQLRADGHDVVAVVELSDLVGRPDVTRFARESGRVVVTENVVDYARLDAGASEVPLVEWL